MKKILLLSVLLFSVSQAAQYKVKVKGTDAGKAELNIIVKGNTYSTALTLYPNMLAKMFGITNMKDASRGVIQQGHFQPKKYQRKTLKGKLLFVVSFLGKQAKKTYKGKTTTVNIHTLGQDPLTQIAQIQFDLKQHTLADRYHLITEKSARTYTVNRKNVNNGTLVTLTETPSAKRVLRLWFSGNGELLRMQKEKRGKIDFDMSR